MKKRTLLTVLLALAAFGAVYAQTTVQRSLYVSAQGDDNNNGRSETTPYKTLEKAAEAANAGVIKTITVIGTIEDGIIRQSGADEILITGKPNASGAERAVISERVSVSGKVRFTHIRLAGIISESASDPPMVTLGAGVVVTNPDDDGVSVGTLIMTDDATITGCRRKGVNSRNVTMSGNASITNNGDTGIYDYEGKVIMSGNASITNNGDTGIFAGYGTVTISGNAKVSDNKGGGVECGTLTMSENAEISRNSRRGAGGRLTMSGNAKIVNNNGCGVYINGNSTISGNARISGNTAKEGGGIYLSGGTLTIEGGEISGNKAEYGAGVYVEKGTFNHKGGTITGNSAEYIGGGVYVKSGAAYTAGGGKVSGNTSGDMGDDNIFRQQ